MAITIDNIWFETQRRIALYRTGTVMPDSSLLGYDGNPNAVDRDNSDGELLLYYSSQGSLFQQSTGDMWRKSLLPNTWVTIGGGSGLGDANGNVTITGDLVVDGDVTLGQPSTAIILGKIGSDLIPTQNDIFSIGSGSKRFLEGHFSELNANVGVTTCSVSTEMVYFHDPGDCDLGLSPTNPAVYDDERNLTYIEVLSSRDTTSIVQTNSADWGNHAPSERIQVLTRSSLNLTFSSSDGNGNNIYYPEFVTVGTDNAAGDARWDDITYAHAMVLPYNTTVKKIILRGTATQSATVNIGIHTNSGVTNPNSIEYKYFTETPTATAENTFQFNNEAKVFTFADTTSALEGETLGISISGTKPISTTNLSIVLAYSD